MSRAAGTTPVWALFSTATLIVFGLAACTGSPDATTSSPAVETTALWLFDEPAGLYPSHTLDDMSDNDMVLTLGLGAQVAPGRYGNALLLASLDPPLEVPPAEEKPGEFGLARLPVPEGRTVEPLSWFTAHYAALMTSGENHLRKQVGHKNPTTSALNLGDFDWTVEFWHSPGASHTGCAGVSSVRPTDGRTERVAGGADRATRVPAGIRRDAAERRARVASGLAGRRTEPADDDSSTGLAADASSATGAEAVNL